VADILRSNGSALTTDLFGEGVGESFDLTRPFLMVSQHPVTTEYGEGDRQITCTLEAVTEVGLPALVFWPNADAGAEDVARGIRRFRERFPHSGFHFFKNLPTDAYITLMTRTACLIGNSSSAIREGPFIGTPAVNIGSRQDQRQRGSNVLDVEHERAAIVAAVRRQVDHGPYASEPIYGDGNAGARIAEVLAVCPLTVEKRIAY
jgi:UDP-N-acetylglucosamine 2-epimerase